MRSNKKVNINNILKKYLRYVLRYKFFVVFLLLSIVLIEIFKIIPKILFGQVIDRGALFAANELTREAFVSYAYFILVLYIISFVALVIIKLVKQTLNIKLESNLIYDLKQKYFNHLIHLDYEFHSGHKTGSLISRMGRGASAMEGLTDVFLHHFIPFFAQVVVVGVSIAYFSLAPAITLFLISATFIIYSFIIQNLQKQDKKNLNDTEDFEKGNMADFFTNIESIKYYGKEKLIEKRYEELTEDTKQKSIKYLNWYKPFDAGQTIILSIGTILMVLFPIMSFLNGDITIGTISFIYASYMSFVITLYGFVWGLRGFYRYTVDFENLFEYDNFSNIIKDKKNAKKLIVKKGEIEFNNISFHYPRGYSLFENLTLKIPAGKKVALIGQSGCGKSTLIRLLYRFYDVRSGEIKIDKKDIRDVKQESLRSEMAVVSQEPILFDDTIYNNIKFSNPKATREEIRKAIKFAQLDKVIKKLPNKEHTIVGERGIKLSGGQKQRVSIARALIANKKILVLDEATSSLDSETENEIQKDLEKLMKNRTSIIIAHRLSTIMNSDLIVVMKEGRIEQIGTHRELITQGGEYEKLWNYQKGGYLQDKID